MELSKLALSAFCAKDHCLPKVDTDDRLLGIHPLHLMPLTATDLEITEMLLINLWALWLNMLQFLCLCSVCTVSNESNPESNSTGDWMECVGNLIMIPLLESL